MIERSIEETEARAKRGLAIYRAGAVGRHRGGYLVASETTAGKIYRVYARTERCECRDYELRKSPCKHVFAVLVAVAKTPRPEIPCASCGTAHRRSSLVELHEGNHDNLAHFDGDLLCPGCADVAGVQR